MYKETLDRYIAKSKQRRTNADSIIQSFLSSDVNSGAPVVTGSGGNSGIGSATASPTGAHSGTASGRKWGNPDASGFAANYLTTIRAPNGQKVTVHKNSAQAFSGFLGALWKQGYHWKDLGSVNNRNIAGTSTKSQHAWGNAIDLDAQANRGDRLGGGGSRQGNLPSNINQLARRFGLTWGGTWKSADPMHFEYTKR